MSKNQYNTSIIQSFMFNNVKYTATLTPELYEEEDGWDFTGSYEGKLKSVHETKEFKLTERDENNRWKSTPKLDAGLVDIFDSMIELFFKDHQKGKDNDDNQEENSLTKLASNLKSN